MTRVRCNLRGVNGEEPATGEAAKNSPWMRDDVDEFYGIRVRINDPQLLNHGKTGRIKSAPHYLRDDALPHYHVIEDGTNRGCFHHADNLEVLT